MKKVRITESQLRVLVKRMIREERLINEVETSFLPVDPLRGAAETYSDILSSIKGGIGSVESKVEQFVNKYILSQNDPRELIPSISRFLGKDVTKLSNEAIFSILKNKLSNSQLSEDIDNSDILELPNKKDKLVDFIVKSLTIMGFVNLASAGSALSVIVYALGGGLIGAVSGAFLSLGIMAIVLIIRSVVSNAQFKARNKRF
jgi:hypothetical protein